jgi:hypothetical protein
MGLVSGRRVVGTREVGLRAESPIFTVLFYFYAYSIIYIISVFFLSIFGYSLEYS